MAENIIYTYPFHYDTLIRKNSINIDKYKIKFRKGYTRHLLRDTAYDTLRIYAKIISDTVEQMILITRRRDANYKIFWGHPVS